MNIRPGFENGVDPYRMCDGTFGEMIRGCAAGCRRRGQRQPVPTQEIDLGESCPINGQQPVMFGVRAVEELTKLRRSS